MAYKNPGWFFLVFPAFFPAAGKGSPLVSHGGFVAFDDLYQIYRLPFQYFTRRSRCQKRQRRHLGPCHPEKREKRRSGTEGSGHQGHGTKDLCIMSLGSAGAQNAMSTYKCVSTDGSLASPDDPTYRVFVSILSYGRRGLGEPSLDLEPKVSGLLRNDAIFWALGQAQIILRNTEDAHITKLDIDGDKSDCFIQIEDPLGLIQSIHIAKERTIEEAMALYPPPALEDSTKPTKKKRLGRR
ncbi:MAG TPA: hypothetical protein VGF97_05570 [Rhizomicrobium sp.]|jgi:hypothetical protein